MVRILGSIIDAIIHCKTREEAEELKEALAARLRECKLELHPDKTKIVYCKDDNHKGNHPETRFDFLGYTFRPRIARTKRGDYFVSFLPAISDKAKKAIRATIRSWNLGKQIGSTLEAIAKEKNGVIRGWINYYGKFYKSEVESLMEYLNKRLVRWATKKYKKLGRSLRKGVVWLMKVMRKTRCLFYHWNLGYQGISGQ